MQTSDTFANRMNTSMHYKYHILSFIDTSLPIKVLDLGCGSGLVGIQFAKDNPTATVVLSDFNDTMLKIAEENAKGIENVSIHENGVQLPHDFDVIIMSSVLHEVLSSNGFNALPFLNEMSMLLNEKGYIVIRDGYMPSSNPMEIELKDRQYVDEFIAIAIAHEKTNETDVNFIEKFISEITLTDNRMIGTEYSIKSLLNKLTWGIESSHREAFESFLVINEASIREYVKGTKFKVVHEEYVCQSDYFEYMKKLAHIDKPWLTHAYVVIQKQ